MRTCHSGGMEWASRQADDRYDALVRAAGSTVVGLDMDGTLSPIVEDPELAHIHPDAPDVLVALSEVVRAVAIITGRPARQALALGGLDEVGEAMAGHSKALYVFGQYGNERWSSTRRRIVTPRPPAGLAGFLRELPRMLRTADATDTMVEEKGLAVGLHTRRLPDPAGTLTRLTTPVGEAAARHGLIVEPGRYCLEVRAPGVSKGDAVRAIAREVGASAFLFAGDDLGDVAAYDAVDAMRAGGWPTLLVASSAGTETSPLAHRADVVVPGPDGVLDLLRRFTADAMEARRAPAGPDAGLALDDPDGRLSRPRRR